MSEIIISQAYTPAEAERGKFAVIDSGTLTSLGYPSSGTYGRYAVLTYNVNPSVINLSGTTLDVDVCAIDINNWDQLISSTYVGQPLSADVSIRNEVTTIEKLPTTSILVCSVSLAHHTSSVFVFSPVITLLEMYNNGSNKVYFTYGSVEAFDDVVGRGMIIEGDSYYSIEKNVSDLTVATVSGADVRIFGHRR